MIGFAARSAVAGGREAVVRLAAIAGAVAVGVALLLMALAGAQAVGATMERYAWMDTTGAPAAKPTDPAPLLWLSREDFVHRERITRLNVAATGPDSPVPPGIPRLPGPGEYYASPELAALLAGMPADQLSARFPGRQVGLVDDAALIAPNSLLVIIGRAPDELAQAPRVKRVTHIRTSLAGSQVQTYADALNLVLSVIAGALIFPLLIFISAATRLNAARREQRFAAMRLVGATPRQVATIATVEAAISAVAGTAVGFLLYAVFRSQVATIPFMGAPFFPADFRISWLNVVIVALGVPVAAAFAARLALRRVVISPLGVSRRVTPRPPRAYRLILLVFGLAWLAVFLVIPRPPTSAGQVRVFLPGLLIVMAGLIVAGPWLTMVGARITARYAGRPASLIAARRLADNPKAAFRAVSGLMLALFVGTVAVSVITTINTHRGSPVTGPEATNLSLQLSGDGSPLSPELYRQLLAIPGVRAAVVVREAPVVEEERVVKVGPSNDQPAWTPPGLIACADLGGHPDFGKCQPGAEVGAVFSDLLVPDWAGTFPLWPDAHLSAAALDSLPVMSIVVGTDGSAAAIERARTLLGLTYPDSGFAAIEAERQLETQRTLNGWKQLATVVILLSLVIAGCSLAVSVIGGLTDRKRPFSLLRLTGVQLGVLRRVVLLESAVPLLAAAAVAVATGLLASHLFLRAQMQYALEAPGLGYGVTVGAGLLGSLVIVVATLPLLRRITGPETARNE